MGPCRVTHEDRAARLSALRATLRDEILEFHPLSAGLLGLATTEAAKALSHTLSFGVVLAVLTNLVQFTAHGCQFRRGTHLRRYAPAYLIATSVPLLLADQTRHVLQDSGIWPAGPGKWSSSMYQSARGQCSPQDAADVCRLPADQGGFGAVAALGKHSCGECLRCCPLIPSVRGGGRR